jgi:DNA-binding response OmpR family regulator
MCSLLLVFEIQSIGKILNDMEYRLQKNGMKNILLIDNDKNVLKFVEQIVDHTKCSFKCTHAASAGQALKLSGRLIPDFIFVNFELANTNGLQFLSAIRQKSKLKDSKVFIYSDNISEETSKLARMLGAAGCIERSNNIDKLSHKLKSILTGESRAVDPFINAG